MYKASYLVLGSHIQVDNFLWKAICSNRVVEAVG
jgi:hypothetical protein